MIDVKDFVFETFLRLTSKTCPYGSEDILMKEIGKLFPDGLQKDDHGNYFHKIGESRTVFASHLDTVSKEYISVTHVFDGDIIRTDGKTTLGADDKAGVTVMLWMIKNKVPGLYYFFIGEEVGCIGSGLASKYGDFEGNYDRIISFDRRGTGSIITFQSCGRCCSDDFADDLCSELNKSGLDYTKDEGGVYTDSAEFADIIPECTNVSVGYYKEHTTTEHQDIKHLSELADACVRVDWENLSTKRDPLVYEPKSYNSYGYTHTSSYPSKNYGYNDDWYDEDFDEGWQLVDGEWVNNTRKNKKKTRRSNKKGKSYYDGGSGLIEIPSKEDYDYTGDDKYSWVLDKFLDHQLTIADLEVVKEQYLDMSSDYDKYFYNYLLEQVY